MTKKRLSGPGAGDTAAVRAALEAGGRAEAAEPAPAEAPAGNGPAGRRAAQAAHAPALGPGRAQTLIGSRTIFFPRPLA